jgi:hypothetical protein
MVSLVSLFALAFVITLCASVILPAGWQLAQPQERRWFFGTARLARALWEVFLL